MPSIEVSPEEIQAFLSGVHGRGVADIEELPSGFWSSAYAYRFDDRELVLRLGADRAGYDSDRQAMAYNAPDLPVPEVIDIGEAFGGSYAISARQHGRFLETARPDEQHTAGPMLVRLLRSLRTASRHHPTPAEMSQWRSWVTDALIDNGRNQGPVTGWRATIAADPHLDKLFKAGQARVHELLDACPQLGHVVHGDLLHGNVLMSEDASHVTAVFSWKCSMLGDSMYDVAWCTFWGAVLYPGIAAAQVFDRVLAEHRPAPDTMAFDDASARHHCYELHIGLRHLGWNAWVGDTGALHQVAAHTEQILEHGPRQPTLP